MSQTLKKLATIDSSYFTSPQAHELALLSSSPTTPTAQISERRVSAIMDDLHRRTSEELESWETIPNDSDTNSVTKLLIPEKTVDEKKWSWCSEKLSTREMVSSPVSYVACSVEVRKTNESTDRVGTVESGKTFESTFESSDKPSFAAFVKRCAKSPPPPMK